MLGSRAEARGHGDSALRKATDGIDERERVLALHTIVSLSLAEDKANKQLMWWDAAEHTTCDATQYRDAGPLTLILSHLS